MKKHGPKKKPKTRVKKGKSGEKGWIGRNSLPIAGALVFLILILTAPYFAPKAIEPEAPTTGVTSVSASTDRTLYRGGGDMEINVTIEADSKTPVDVYVHGIKAGKTERLNALTNQVLERGRSIITFQYKLPECTGCAGIIPGNYTITAEVKANGKTDTNSLTVEIRK
jgi:hypothetical protein